MRGSTQSERNSPLRRDSGSLESLHEPGGACPVNCQKGPMHQSLAMTTRVSTVAETSEGMQYANPVPKDQATAGKTHCPEWANVDFSRPCIDRQPTRFLSRNGVDYAPECRFKRDASAMGQLLVYEDAASSLRISKQDVRSP